MQPKKHDSASPRSAKSRLGNSAPNSDEIPVSQKSSQPLLRTHYLKGSTPNLVYALFLEFLYEHDRPSVARFRQEARPRFRALNAAVLSEPFVFQEARLSDIAKPFFTKEHWKNLKKAMHKNLETLLEQRRKQALALLGAETLTRALGEIEDLKCKVEWAARFYMGQPIKEIIEKGPRRVDRTRVSAAISEVYRWLGLPRKRGRPAKKQLTAEATIKREPGRPRGRKDSLPRRRATGGP